MATSLIIFLIIMGQLTLALFYFSQRKSDKKTIPVVSYWPTRLVYLVPLLTWIVYIQKNDSNYSFLGRYSKIIFIIIIGLSVMIVFFENWKRRKFK